MARLPRFAISGQPQHIILRGNNRTELFLEEADFHFFWKNCRPLAKNMAVTCMPMC